MNTTAIDRYLTTRIAENAEWYGHHKPMLKVSYTLDDIKAQLFYVLSFASILSLSEGHTVLMVPKQQGGLQNLFEPVIDYLSSQVKDERFLVDFDEILGQIDRHQDKASLKELVDGYCRTFHQSISPNSKAWAAKTMDIKGGLDGIFLGLLKVYYLMKFILHDDMERLMSVMHDTPFVDDYQAEQSGRPLIIKDTPQAFYLWSNRAWRAERMAMQHIWRICMGEMMPFDVSNLPATLNDEQRLAVETVSRQAFTIITGGPGTGKTFTVAQIVLALLKQNPDTDLALAAPTGKAAQRMSESLKASLMGADIQINLPEPKTIHRLLGIGRHGTPRYHDRNAMPYDIIIVDEASMLGAELSCHLLAAVKTGARLILLGDAHQLAAVEAGAVLADLCRVDTLQSHRVHLVESKRFHSDSDVGRLANFINDTPDTTHKGSEVITLMQVSDELSFVDIDKQAHYYERLALGYQEYFEATKTLLAELRHDDETVKYQKVQRLFNTLNQYRVLCASHIGDAGDDKINEFLSKKHREWLNTRPSASPWYHGRVVMVQTNRYDLGLFNGDVGICLYDGTEMAVYFDGEILKKVSIGMLGGETVRSAYAMTVHKSQGSEFEQVAVVFDDDNARLLSKELIYTAITRAKKSVSIYTTEQTLQLAVSTPTVRTTGLGLL
ncbi:MAG: exodeoxyribonuclease V subunit alpha [Moraxella sp.]|nr:exodeoxyribonuclease V subunit alpha [Moraxella sp.]